MPELKVFQTLVFAVNPEGRHTPSEENPLTPAQVADIDLLELVPQVFKGPAIVAQDIEQASSWAKENGHGYLFITGLTIDDPEVLDSLAIIDAWDHAPYLIEA